jgi:hypothetical protein
MADKSDTPPKIDVVKALKTKDAKRAVVEQTNDVIIKAKGAGKSKIEKIKVTGFVPVFEASYQAYLEHDSSQVWRIMCVTF